MYVQYVHSMYTVQQRNVRRPESLFEAGMDSGAGGGAVAGASKRTHDDNTRRPWIAVGVLLVFAACVWLLELLERLTVHIKRKKHPPPSGVSEQASVAVLYVCLHGFCSACRLLECFIFSCALGFITKSRPYCVYIPYYVQILYVQGPWLDQPRA